MGLLHVDKVVNLPESSDVKFDCLKWKSTSAMVAVSILDKRGCCGHATERTTSQFLQVLILLLKGSQGNIL